MNPETHRFEELGDPAALAGAKAKGWKIFKTGEKVTVNGTDFAMGPISPSSTSSQLNWSSDRLVSGYRELRLSTSTAIPHTSKGYLSKRKNLRRSSENLGVFSTVQPTQLWPTMRAVAQNRIDSTNRPTSWIATLPSCGTALRLSDHPQD
jgi:hypothetical protein